jgi:type III secretion protein V
MADLKFISAKISDIFLVLFVLAIALMLFVPLPTFSLDFLLTANIAFAFLLLLVGLYMPNSLALLAFPSLLLLTTLFRLALNVASTRLILSQGEAGKVIEAFGTFLISGEVLVGIVIFIIITIVNLLVIAKGAGRVSEVAARFALDALPGKQLAIDADLRAGLIDANIAQEKRENLRKESQLYGAMDGSMKFVQNDAIAGVVIIFTNILGGMYQGLSKGLSFGEAAQVYTTLTIGDGLVSQIPALLISICAGIVVTRVSSSDKSTLGSDVSKQVFQNPYLLSATAVLLAALGLISNLPIIPFAVICSILFLTSIYIYNKNRSEFFKTNSSSQMLIESEKGNSLLLESGGNKLICHLSSDLYSNYKKSVHSVHESWLLCSNEIL